MPDESNLIANRPLVNDLNSDYFAVEYKIEHPNLKKRKLKSFETCSLRRLNISELKQDILLSESVPQPSTDLDRLVKQYRLCLSKMLDE